jgi:DNA-binding NarL/FixJ family response regulator
MMREALAGVVDYAWPDAHITKVPDFPEAWAAADEQPDLCLCDLGMPGASPVEGIARLREIMPATPILVITGQDDDETLLDLFALNIAGFIPKTSKSAAIEAAIRVVLSGEPYLPPRLLALAARGRARTNAADPAANPSAPRLTDRQMEVLTLIATGQSNKEIARSFGLSPATVKAHSAAIIAALGARNRAEAVAKAQAAGLL